MIERVESEKQRLTALLFDCGISEKRMAALDPVLDNVAWMRVKLDDTRDDIKNAKVVIAHENKLKKNPLFEGYEALFKSYMSGIREILTLLPEEQAVIVEEDKPKTVLELMREKHDRKSKAASNG